MRARARVIRRVPVAPSREQHRARDLLVYRLRVGVRRGRVVGATDQKNGRRSLDRKRSLCAFGFDRPEAALQIAVLALGPEKRGGFRKRGTELVVTRDIGRRRKIEAVRRVVSTVEEVLVGAI